MTYTTVYLLALLIGVVAGLRAMTAPAAVSWAAHLGLVNVSGTLLAFMGAAYTPYIFTVLALGEMVSDQLPGTPSRKVPVQFATRIASGALCGAVLGIAGGSPLLAALAGAAGAVIGTLGGALARGRLAKAFGKDVPAALLEDAIAVVGAILIVTVQL